MFNNQIDLTGNPTVEKAIRDYAKLKMDKQNQVVFVEGVANRERKRINFSINNNYLHKINKEELELYNRNNSKAWERHYKADKTRRRYEELQIDEYISK